MPAEIGWTLGVDVGRDWQKEQIDWGEKGRRKRGRPRLRWENCVRRDISKVWVVGDWRDLAEDRGRWRSIVVKAGQKLGSI